MPLRRNIIIFHQGALGDFIVTWPLALGMARVFAQSRVFYVTAGQKGALAEKALRVESADVEAGWHQLFSTEPTLPEPAARLLGALSRSSALSAGRKKSGQRMYRSSHRKRRSFIFLPYRPIRSAGTLPSISWGNSKLIR